MAKIDVYAVLVDVMGFATAIGKLEGQEQSQVENKLEAVGRFFR